MQHLYHIGHYNPKGYVQRDSISCRRDHHTSPTAHFAHGFDKGGSPISRTGYMVPCRKHSDCMPCGRHPLTDQHYQCQRRYVLYDTVYTDDDNDLVFLNDTAGSASAFDIDLEAGAATGKTGICVDIDSSYNEGCASRIGSAVKDGLVGCMDGFYSQFLCGLSLEVFHGDLSTVQTSGNVFYENGGRVLLSGANDRDGDEENGPEWKCTNPIDCSQKCLLLERKSPIPHPLPLHGLLTLRPRLHRHVSPRRGRAAVLRPMYVPFSNTAVEHYSRTRFPLF